LGASTDLVVVFERAHGPHLLSAERMLRAWPQLFAGAVDAWELASSREPPTLFAVAHLRGEKLEPHVRARFAFWAREAGGAALLLGALSEHARTTLSARIESAPARAMGRSLSALPGELDRLIASTGVIRAGDALKATAPVLQLSLGSGSEAAVYDPVEQTLFVSTPSPLPIGDRVSVSLRVPGETAAFAASGQVEWSRGPDEGRRGFTLALDAAPPGLRDAHERWLERKKAPAAQGGAERRIFDRHPVKAPARLKAPQSLSSRYETAEQLAADWVENLSLGGALIRTASPPPVGERVVFEMQLPNGKALTTPAVVVRSTPGSAAVQFELTQAVEAELEQIVAKVSQRAKRALVVDDDRLQRTMLVDALEARGFEVLTADSGQRALEVLLEELLGLDALVTDLWMPGMDGEALVKKIRVAGGEQDLVIVVMSGRMPAPQTLAGVAIDAVVNKSIGAAPMAAAVEEAIDRRRGATADGRGEPAPAAPVLRVGYPTMAALLADGPTLTMGGVFVRGRSMPPQTAVTVHLVLPSGAVLRADGEVVSAEGDGVGVIFELKPDDREALAAMLERGTRTPAPRQPTG
jgi:CheY-like chemotaxis protein